MLAAVNMMFASRLPNLKSVVPSNIFKYLHVTTTEMDHETIEVNKPNIHSITEGAASIKTAGKVFYNPVQEFNRDLRLDLSVTFFQKISFFLVFQC